MRSRNFKAGLFVRGASQCVLGTFAIVSGACDGGVERVPAPWEFPIPFDTGTARIISGADTVVLLVEIAESSQQQALGLMDRPTLDPGSGMVFAYDAVQDSADGFWMFRTRVALDIAFADSAGRIVAIRAMNPCDSPSPQWCPAYTPGVRYQTALEVNQGFFGQMSITPGALLEVDQAGRR